MRRLAIAARYRVAARAAWAWSRPRPGGKGAAPRHDGGLAGAAGAKEAPRAVLRLGAVVAWRCARVRSCPARGGPAAHGGPGAQRWADEAVTGRRRRARQRLAIADPLASGEQRRKRPHDCRCQRPRAPAGLVPRLKKCSAARRGRGIFGRLTWIRCPIRQYSTARLCPEWHVISVVPSRPQSRGPQSRSPQPRSASAAPRGSRAPQAVAPKGIRTRPRQTTSPGLFHPQPARAGA